MTLYDNLKNILNSNLKILSTNTFINVKTDNYDDMLNSFITTPVSDKINDLFYSKLKDITTHISSFNIGYSSSLPFIKYPDNFNYTSNLDYPHFIKNNEIIDISSIPNSPPTFLDYSIHTDYEIMYDSILLLRSFFNNLKKEYNDNVGEINWNNLKTTINQINKGLYNTSSINIIDSTIYTSSDSIPNIITNHYLMSKNFYEYLKDTSNRSNYNYKQYIVYIETMLHFFTLLYYYINTQIFDSIYFNILQIKNTDTFITDKLNDLSILSLYDLYKGIIVNLDYVPFSGETYTPHTELNALYIELKDFTNVNIIDNSSKLITFLDEFIIYIINIKNNYNIETNFINKISTNVYTIETVPTDKSKTNYNFIFSNQIINLNNAIETYITTSTIYDNDLYKSIRKYIDLYKKVTLSGSDDTISPLLNGIATESSRNTIAETILKNILGANSITSIKDDSTPSVITTKLTDDIIEYIKKYCLSNIVSVSDDLIEHINDIKYNITNINIEYKKIDRKIIEKIGELNDLISNTNTLIDYTDNINNITILDKNIQKTTDYSNSLEKSKETFESSNNSHKIILYIVISIITISLIGFIAIQKYDDKIQQIYSVSILGLGLLLYITIDLLKRFILVDTSENYTEVKISFESDFNNFSEKIKDYLIFISNNSTFQNTTDKVIKKEQDKYQKLNIKSISNKIQKENFNNNILHSTDFNKNISLLLLHILIIFSLLYLVFLQYPGNNDLLLGIGFVLFLISTAIFIIRTLNKSRSSHKNFDWYSTN